MSNSLVINDVEKSFSKKQVLNHISCELTSGVYAILGPNGTGKTTLMRCIAGLYSYKGVIEYNKKNIKKKKINIGYLPQQFGLFPELTIEQMMEYFCNLKEIPKRDRKDLIDKSLEKVNLLDVKHKKTKHLSGGMVRRVGIAQAILGNPNVILLDEPTDGLDPEERMRFKNIVGGLGEDSIVLISTHIVEDVEACCSNIIVVKDGKIIKNGTVKEVQEYANNRIVEVDEEKSIEDNILYVEKSILRNGKKKIRIITRNKIEESLEPTVEDGYLCMLKEN